MILQQLSTKAGSFGKVGPLNSTIFGRFVMVLATSLPVYKFASVSVRGSAHSRLDLTRSLVTTSR